jgi:hypothetical protein
MAVSSAITDALLNAVQDGGAIGAGVLGLVIAVSMFKHMRRTVNTGDGVEKGLFIDDRDPELLGLVEDYADERNAQVGSHESDGTYEYYYRNREAFDDIRAFIESSGSPLDAEEEDPEASTAS